MLYLNCLAAADLACLPVHPDSICNSCYLPCWRREPIVSLRRGQAINTAVAFFLLHGMAWIPQ